MEAGKVGEDTALGRLIQLVQEAERQKAPFLRIADRYARYFTPAIIALALIVFLVTRDVYRAITVLIAGCPCAFILASPTAVVSALGNASKNGILVKGGASWRRPRASMRSSLTKREPSPAASPWSPPSNPLAAHRRIPFFRRPPP